MDKKMTVKDAELRLEQMKNGKIPPKEVPTLANPMYEKAYDGFMKHGTTCNTLREGSDGEGGYLVPDEFDAALFRPWRRRTSCANWVPSCRPSVP